MQKKEPEVSDFDRQVYAVIRQVPRGRLATYGQVARVLGRPGAARAVGNALHKNPWAPDIPCHRIIKANGDIGGYVQGRQVKTSLLASEGINIKDGQVINFNRYLIHF